MGDREGGRVVKVDINIMVRVCLVLSLMQHMLSCWMRPSLFIQRVLLVGGANCFVLLKVLLMGVEYGLVFESFLGCICSCSC